MKALKAKDWVEIRSKEDILRTLDSKGQIDGMPFMPEMLAFCGKKMQVYKRAHKTCDTVFPVRGRRVADSVHLETRCDGQAHGGCQAGCLLFWKQEWLKPISNPSENGTTTASTSQPVNTEPAGGCSESTVWANTTRISTVDGPVYSCQATQLPYATTELAWWDIRQYVEDYSSGNVGIGRMICGLLYSAYYNLSEAGIGVGRPMRWLYNKLCPVWGGTLFPRTRGQIPVGQQTPAAALSLQPGDMVRVKSHAEIIRTVNTANQNRGMSWDAELSVYCGGTYRVLKRVSRIVDEKAGMMLEFKTPSIILDSVVCQARYSNCRMFCPRALYPYWREIWLEKV